MSCCRCLTPCDYEWQMVNQKMQSSIVKHRGRFGGVFTSYNVLSIQQVQNQHLMNRYNYRKNEIVQENYGQFNELMLFHGTTSVCQTVHNGFDERFAKCSGMFGAGIYFAENSSKSNMYVTDKTGCSTHHNVSCYQCPRYMLYCRVLLGKTMHATTALKTCHAPVGYHSVSAVPSAHGIRYPEYVVYRGDQVYPEYIVCYTIVP